MTEKELLEMPLHSCQRISLLPTSYSYVIRVVNGWIYEVCNNHSCFVPEPQREQIQELENPVPMTGGNGINLDI